MNTKKEYESIFIFGGYLSGLSILILYTWVTITAYLSNSKTITIHINRYGEQYGDLLTVIFFWLLCIAGFLFLYKRVKKSTQNKIED